MAQMSLEASAHWKHKRRFRPDISEDMIMTVIIRGKTTRDPHWAGTLNSIARIPPPGRTLKVVYRILDPKRYRIIAAYWLD